MTLVTPARLVRVGAWGAEGVAFLTLRSISLLSEETPATDTRSRAQGHAAERAFSTLAATGAYSPAVPSGAAAEGVPRTTVV